MARWFARAALVSTLAATPAAAQERTGTNAVTQAEDAFGFSVGREAIGIYSSSNARGFSPSSAGNVRIDGLYFEPVTDLTDLLRDQVQVKVGLSAQGYPFAAPSGVVDLSLTRPGAKAGASLFVSGDSNGTILTQFTGAVPLGQTLSARFGLGVGRTGYPDGTVNRYDEQALALRWQPSAAVAIMPFWSRYRDHDDQVGEFYVPAGNFLPPLPPPHHFAGPRWAAYNLDTGNLGVLASLRPASDWVVRLGAFRSKNTQLTGGANLLTDLQPDGRADRVYFADPVLRARAWSGELRVTHSLAEGPRLHVLHLSLRERDTRREFGGSDSIDLGPTRVGVDDASPMPDFRYGPTTRVRIRQDTLGLAYDGRWKGVGELGVSVAKARYRKTTTLPGLDPVRARAEPWLYDVTLALTVTQRLSVYGGLARGLEESGLAPGNAANRNAPLPAIITRQKDAGVRYALTPGLKLVAGVFDLTKPYFGFDAARNFGQVGLIRSRGAEFSLAGKLTPTLNVVAGGYFLDPRVEKDATATGVIGRRPVGLALHLVNLNLDWRTPMPGLSVDGALSHRDRAPGTTDNLVYVGARTMLSLGARYRFTLAGKAATVRVQGTNLNDSRGFNSAGPGIYNLTNGRAVNAWLAVDL
ncbi:MAG: TonB-dependent receptor [Sphingomonadales bacterium]|nr:TonB-dependent receptor [Sphingomonadales bacterium]